MLNTSFSPWPSFSEAEGELVKAVLLSNKVNYWTGSECREFEREFADWAGTKHAVALANGTLALDAALHALGVGCGDEVIVTPRSFIASASCVVNAGAKPVFADVDRETQNINAATIAAVLTERTKAVICVHLAGMPCDMDPIMELARKHNFSVIEDCAQAHGARYKGRSVGSIGHIGAWSFCQDKIMTTGGEGGMVTCNDDRWWDRIWSRKDHGKSWDAMHSVRQRKGVFSWVHDSFGTNWRMLELQAALGRYQLRQVADWTASRTAHARRLAASCAPFDVVRIPAVPQGITHAYYKFYAFVRPEKLAAGWTRDRILEEINAHGVPCQQGSCPEIYLEQAFDGTGLRPARPLPAARELGETSLMLLVHPTLSEAEIALSCAVLRQVLSAASSADESFTSHPETVPDYCATRSQ
ncbi:DegT/DnrJ/EryC1/StrS aminotransferase family protein [Oxalobacteraceae bacterium OM1]|nr:DegT/DnrJ/EryC1/StrS aminotransferase family protein [Oxalobacteraceae bacterium OM1]